MKQSFIFAAGIAVGLTFTTIVAAAWTGPTAAPPGNNVSAPINVGTTNQVKNANIGVNGLAVFGNSLLDGTNGDGNGNGVNSYLNFGATAGSSGYGIRDNAGTLEFKNNSGSWASIQSTVNTLITNNGQWTAGSGGVIYYNGGSVGIGTASPASTLDVTGSGTRAAYIRGSSTDYSIPITFLNSAVPCGSGGQWGFGINGTSPSTFSTMPIGSFWIHQDCAGARMVFTANGRVGIGTNNPTQQLDVAGWIHTSAGIQFPDGTTQTTAAGGYQRVTYSVGPSYASTITASCPSGKKVLGGGVSTSNNYGCADVNYNQQPYYCYPGSDSSYTCQCGGFWWYSTVYAICANISY